MSRHRSGEPVRVRARYGRIAMASLSFVVTAVALLGGVGVLPLPQQQDQAEASARTPSADHGVRPTTASPKQAPKQAPKQITVSRSTSALPTGSGSGRRIVFSQSSQRVWLVGATGKVISTYLVSGSLTDNLHAGSYRVYSHSRRAVGVDDSGAMQYFVRFAHGAHAAIGFHSIPTKGGRPLQSFAQLGSPQSHGCIRQRLSDAVRLWGFAPVGTSVVVI